MTDDSGGSVLLSLRIISTLKKKKKEKKRIQPPLWLEGRKTLLVNIEKLGCCKAKYTRGEKKTNLQALCDRLCIFNSESIYAKQLLLLPPNCPKQQEGNTPRYFFWLFIFWADKTVLRFDSTESCSSSTRQHSRQLEIIRSFVFCICTASPISLKFLFSFVFHRNTKKQPPPQKK